MLRRNFLTTALLGSTTALFAGCQGATTASEKAELRREIDAGVAPTLERLTVEIPSARDDLARAAGALVFPSATRAGLGIGGEYGRGALVSGGRTLGYYSLSGGSVGLQIGAETRSIVVLFLTPDALRGFQDMPGFTFGANASISTPQKGEGATARNTGQTMQTYIFANSGFLLNASLEGAKIEKLDLS